MLTLQEAFPLLTIAKTSKTPNFTQRWHSFGKTQVLDNKECFNKVHSVVCLEQSSVEKWSLEVNITDVF